MKKTTILFCLLISINLLVFAQSPYIHKVFDYRPAPGQYVNVLPEYEAGDTHETMLQKVEEAIVGDEKGLVTLGAYGGYIVFGFDHLVENKPGKYDFKIWGNAYYYSTTPVVTGACEPGIVMVSYDVNGNGIPDDPWYELAGSEYYKPETIKNYEITYFKPDPDKIPTPDPNFPFLTDTSYVKWTDNQGYTGYVAKNAFHPQPYYPQWIGEETLIYEGAKLANNGVNESGAGNNFVQYPYAWGYADNHPNDNILSNFDIGWAVDNQGNKVELPGIHFVKVYTGVNQYCGRFGETSTEIMGAEDFHIQGIEIDVLSVQTDIMPDAKIFFAQGKLHLINLDDCYCTIYNTNGQIIKTFYNATSLTVLCFPSPASGIYLLKAQKRNAVRIFKFYK
ncbi:MAG: T9SS type A sorting domain-containing protein [Bacteroidales bacterium]|jgi:hypothetical protein|nr:T9SS type A sorting domain-containing protein [Bacteroidales bacterium]